MIHDYKNWDSLGKVPLKETISLLDIYISGYEELNVTPEDGIIRRIIYINIECSGQL